MSATVRIVVLGNCQAHALETLAGYGCVNILADSIRPVYELTDADRVNIEEKFASADIIFAQRVSDDFPISWLSTNAIKDIYKNKVITWPNIYFDGYFPDVQYLYIGAGVKALSPLEDYHFGSVLNAYRNGLTVAQAVAAMQEGTPNCDSFEDSLKNLRQREDDIDVTISDFLQKVVYERRAFYTPNHPYSFVLSEMLNRLAKVAGLKLSCNTIEYKLGSIYIPSHRSIYRMRHLPFDHDAIYCGREVIFSSCDCIELGGEKNYEPNELVAEYYNVYERYFGKQ